MLKDLRFATRALLKSPGFTLVALLALALGTGANTAIFSVIDAVLLRPLQFPEPDRLMRLSEENGGSEMGLAYLNFTDLREQSRSFREVAGYWRQTVTLAGIEPAERAQTMLVSAEFFDLTGAKPTLGRVFTPDEDRPGAPLVALISDSMWNRKFGRQRDIVGSKIVLDGESYTIAGVFPRIAEPFDTVDVLLPLGSTTSMGTSRRVRGDHTNLRALAALKPGITVAQARAELEEFYARLEKQYPASNSGVRSSMAPLLERMVSNVKPALWILFAAVGFVLLIACVNVANLMLARSSVRRREIAVRSALGASRFALVRHFLAESLVISVGGAILGMLGAYWGLDTIRFLAPDGIARLDQAGLNWSAFGFTLALSVVAAIACGIVPALTSTRTDLIEAMRSGGRTATSSAASERSRSTLLVAEVALAMVLLAGAGLMLRTLHQIRNIEPGFDARNLLCVDLTLSRSYKGEGVHQFWDSALDKIRAIPGVRAASAAQTTPMMESNWNSIFTATNWTTPPRAEMPSSMFTPVESGYFEATGMRLARGRWLTASDGHEAPPVIVVNQTLAARLWPGRDPVGQRLKQGWPEDPTRWREVVGVVADSRQASLDQTPMMQVFLPNAQIRETEMTMVIRTDGDPRRVATAAERAIHQIDPQLPVYNIRTMEELMAGSYVRQRFETGLLEVFAAIALLLAALGIYGVTSYMVSQRITEIGVRVALGADRGDVLGMVLRRALAPSLIGLLIGTAGAVAASRAMKSMLYGVAGTDPVTLGTVAAIFLATAMLASVGPAWRALRVDPIEALRSE